MGASFGLLTSIFLFFSGDESAYQVTQKQPMKLAAMEGIYEGEHRAGLVAFGILNLTKSPVMTKVCFCLTLRFLMRSQF